MTHTMNMTYRSKKQVIKLMAGSTHTLFMLMSMALLMMVLGVNTAWGYTTTYHIINLGKLNDNGQLTTNRTEALKFTSNAETIGVPDQYKSPLAKGWKYYAADDVTFNSTTKVCTFKGEPSLHEGLGVTADAHVYVTYEIDEAAFNTINIHDGGIYRIKADDKYYLQQTHYNNDPNTSFTSNNSLPTDADYCWRFNIIDPYQITIQTKSSTSVGSYGKLTDFYLCKGGNYGDIRLRKDIPTAKDTKVWAFALLPGGTEGTYRIIVADGATGTDAGMDANGHGYINRGSGKSRYNQYSGASYNKCDLTLTPLEYNYTYNIVDKDNRIAIKYTTTTPELVGRKLTSYTDIPQAIRSPYLRNETMTFYSFSEDEDYDASKLIGDNEIDGTPFVSGANIYVRYTTDHLTDADKILHLQGARILNVKVNGDYIYDDNGTLAHENTDANKKTQNRIWYITGQDPYAVQIQNSQTNNYIEYNTGTGALTLSNSLTNYHFILLEGSAPGDINQYEQMELVAATGTTELYRIARDGDNFSVSTSTAAGTANAQVQVYPETATLNYYLIDKANKLIAGPLSHTASRLTLPDEWISPLVSTYHFYTSATISDGTYTVDTSTEVTLLSQVTGGSNVYVTYDVSNAIDITGGKTYMMRFDGEYFNQEDGNDGVMGTTRKAMYPYNNGDFALYVYGDERWNAQLESGASTRSRWLWYIISNHNDTNLGYADPYHVIVKSYQNQKIKISDAEEYEGHTYLRTYKPNETVGVVTSVSYENPTYSAAYNTVMPHSRENGNPTEYMLIGTSLGKVKLVTYNKIGDERYTVDKFEQYWKNNPTVKTQAGKANPDPDDATMAALNWHRYEAWAYSAPWDESTKGLANGNHWFQTISMGTGEFIFEEVSLEPQVILLDKHGWEIMRIPLDQTEKLKEYNSPMVERYHWYPKATKTTGYHKYTVSAPEITIYEKNDKNKWVPKTGSNSTYVHTSTSLADSPYDHITPVQDVSVKTDFYVTYTVKSQYANTFTGSSTEGELPNATFLLKQNNKLITTTNGTDVSTTNPESGSDNKAQWYLRPNFNIDREMGYRYKGESGAQAEAKSKTVTDNENYTAGLNGFDPYNIQILNFQYQNQYLTANTTGSHLDGGAWKGTSSTISLENIATKQTVTGYDQTTLNITNATFLAVQDKDGNLRLMPRFDHQTVITNYSGLSTFDLESHATQSIKLDRFSQPTVVHSSDEFLDMNGHYLLASDFTFTSSVGTSDAPFTGIIDGQMNTLTGQSVALVAYARGATIKNVIFKSVNIPSGTNVGAICNEADGSTRIYNCGVLSGSVSGSNYVGGLVGWLKGESRVINCYSYANVSGGSSAAGIVGYNAVATTMSNLKTMVMNCMFYGNITGASSMKPVYGGQVISNAGTTGVNNYNYYRNGKDVTFDDNYASFDAYYCSLPADEEYLTRFEYYRSILNSNKKLCAWWISGTSGTVPTDADVEEVGIAKWVLDPEIAPYPILKEWRYYPSVINKDTEYAWNPKTKQNVVRTMADPYQGKQLGTISVTVDAGAKHAGTGATSVTLPSVIVMDMDTLNHDYCYAKIQLPYYNEVFGNQSADAATQWDNRYAGNYKDYVVTGWKVTSITGGTPGTFKGYAVSANGSVSSGDVNPDDTSGKPWEDGFNFADRNCTNKDLYSKSGRVFAQGGYFYVPEGVSAITIEAYWGKAVYLHNSEHSLDRVNVASGGAEATTAEFGTAFSPAGTLPTTFQGQTVQTTLQEAIGQLTENSALTVYDQAIVLVGNVQVKNRDASVGNNTTTKRRPFTIMSIDEDMDNEPDYCLEFQFRQDISRPGIHPVRFDFLPVPELGLAIRTDEKAYAIGIFIPQGHFEITETSFMHTTQFEFDSKDINKVEAPVILNGGHFEQIVVRYGKKDATSYFLLGGNFRISRFTPGYHATPADGALRHCAVNAIGGEFPEFYLSGIYYPNKDVVADNPHCYINGGRFGTLAGAGYEPIKGDVTFKIDHAIIDNFYGGGLNAAKPVTGSIDVTINNSIVYDTYCGGPKVGPMTKTNNVRKTVTTTANNSIFGKFFGGGNGGTSYYRENQYDNVTTWPSNWKAGTYKFPDFNPLNTNSNPKYDDNKGYHDLFEFEVFNSSNGLDNKCVARTFIYWAQFGTTTTGTVTNNLTNCTIENNFYGGGNLGNVDGDVNSTLTNTQVKGAVFGGGYSAEIPRFRMHDRSDASVRVPHRNKAGQIDEQGSLEYVKDNGVDRYYRWTNDDNGGQATTSSPTYWSVADNEYKCYTPISLAGLGEVSGNVTLIINGNTVADENGKVMKVAKSVYGGGEESGVNGSTSVTINGGTIGTANYGGAEYGNVYGGGKGKEKNVTAGLVKGNTTVSISGSPTIIHNVYGGGAYGSVGEFDYDTTGMPTARKANTTGGNTSVTITGGTIGTTGQENGMVFGSSRGDVAVPEGNPAIDPNDRMAWVYKTEVVIGQTNDQTAGPQIKGSIYGSGENGHTFNDTYVNVHSGTIGIESGEEVTYQGIKYSGPRYLFRGNVYGGGCGTDTYKETDAQEITKTYYNFNAGIVKGNTNVTIDGGHIVHNVYGGGAMGSVGTYTSFIDDAYNTTHPDAQLPVGKPNECAENTGKCTVVISGGVIGVAGAKMTAGGGPDDYGHVFGAGRGDTKDPVEYPNVEISAYYNQTDVTISGSALVTGGVYGGSESGHVLNDTKVTITGNCQIGVGEGKTAAYTQEEWTAQSPGTLKPTSHWTYVDDGAPYDQYADENGNYANNVSSEGGNRKATDGHTFYGNVFAGGSGYYPYAQGKWLFSAGCVEGDATLEITGGHILNNVYGGCEMSDVLGNVSVTMSGGTVGVPRTKAEILLLPTVGHIFGAGMGDKRIFFNQVTNVATTTVSVSGGRVYGSVYGGGEDGHVLGLVTTTISGDVVIGSVTDGTTSGFDGNVFGGGQGSPTALTAGTVGGNVILNINGGTMHGSVYGGGRIASVGTFFELAKIQDPNFPDDPTKLIDNPAYGKMQDGTEHGYITVNLKGGTIHQNAYGGCMGTVNESAAVAQNRFAISKNVTVNLNEGVADDVKGCIVKGSIFGCNNVNSSPQEDVTVHVYATQNVDASKIYGEDANADADHQPKKVGRFDVKAVYGGGNMAAYKPKGPNAATAEDGYDGKNTRYSTHVIIDGCERTSIQQVYGGGNAASTPATEVTVNGTYEIDELFGGGNGADKISYDEGATKLDNPGANVGFYDYSAEEETYNTKEKRTTDEELAPTFISKYVYGTGKAAVNVFGGKINHVFGGSNTKGNVRETAITLLEEKTEENSETPCCPFRVGDVYGGGKSAPMDADAKMYMACIPGLRAAYGGAEEADIQGGVTLNITNGRFDRVFGGNNISGTIHGPIEVNIEETGCRPIIIGELYGGGNLAAYSVYGYNADGSIKESGTKIYKDPVVNVKSFTSIGKVFGGGYGETATVVGSPTVNINVAMGDKATHSEATIDENAKSYDDEQGYPVPSHASGKIGAITNVYGGGNEARVIGNTNVNIGTVEEVYMLVNKEMVVGTTDVSSYYTRTGGEGTAESPYVYTPCAANSTAAENTIYYERHDVLGADIRGNVYGGGNNAVVTGNANVTIGRKKAP